MLFTFAEAPGRSHGRSEGDVDPVTTRLSLGMFRLKLSAITTL